jgi:hypothetical protein
MTKLDRIFNIYDTEADAIRSWGETPLLSDPLVSETVA